LYIQIAAGDKSQIRTGRNSYRGGFAAGRLSYWMRESRRAISGPGQHSQRKLHPTERKTQKSMKKTVIWLLAFAAALAAGMTFWMREHNWKPRTITLQGTVLRSDKDPRGQQPIADATVTASNGTSSVSTQSAASGYFKLELGAGVWPQKVIHLAVEHPGYKSLELAFLSGIHTPPRLFIAALDPTTPPVRAESTHAHSVISNIRVRYTVNLRSDTNIGSAVRTFQVENRGNVPCDHHEPCSPQGQWKAAKGSITLDAGTGNMFRDVRASCIAGPCPFTRIDSSGFAKGGRTITATALDWSDTATFLLEAEVFRDSIDSSVRESYPVIFGQTLHFTLPQTQEGVSIEADMNGTPMVFPLGPDLYLSWADCTARTNTGEDASTVYQCELKPGYRF
jgi:hypothetical protein